MKRVISLWLPVFATDRLTRKRAGEKPADTPHGFPLATVTQVHGGMRIAAANPAAQAAGVMPGQSLADARALYPRLVVRAADPAGDLKALDRLAQACTRFTPWTAVDAVWGGGPNGGLGGGLGAGAGLWLDVTGCAHLFGGEDVLVEELLAWLARLGFAARAGLADTPGAAWALARHTTTETAPHTIAPPGKTASLLAPLPMAALRLDGAVVEGLARLGLRRVADVMAMPRGPLAKRFGGAVLKRLDQALGHMDEPISPRRPPAVHQARLAFAEPIGRTEDIAAGLRTLLNRLCAGLEDKSAGARRLELALHRVDGTTAHATAGTSRPVRDAAHLARLFADKLEGLDPGFGVEVMTLFASDAEPLHHSQAELAGEAGGDGDMDAARLVDRLSGRLGARQITRFTPVASHVPERAVRAEAALTAGKRRKPEGVDWQPPPLDQGRPPRPVTLLPQPAPIDVMAPVPDGPPVMFRWRRRQHAVSRAEGPERIEPEWWRRAGRGPVPRVRDYYRLEDSEGRRYWVYREGLYRPDRPPAWFLHGFFA